VPAFPFFLINLAMGLTPLRTWTFAWVSFLGMLPGAFVYVNAGMALGSVDSPSEVLSRGVLISLALLGLAPLGLRLVARWKVRLRTVGLVALGLVLLAVAGIGVRSYFRYRTFAVMEVPVTEYANADYPEDPAYRSVHFGQYTGRKLTLVQTDETHFDLVFEAPSPDVAKVVFRDIDVSLMTPGLPEWTKADPGLTRIALTDRQWNRQQVRFDRGSSPGKTARRPFTTTAGSPFHWATTSASSSTTPDSPTGSTGITWSTGSTQPGPGFRWTVSARC